MLGLHFKKGRQAAIAMFATVAIIGLGMSPAAAHDPQAEGDAAAIQGKNTGANGLLSQVFGPVLDGGTCHATWSSTNTQFPGTQTGKCGNNLQLMGPNGATAYTQAATTDENRHVEAAATVAPVQIPGLGEGLDLTTVFGGIDVADVSDVLNGVFGALDCTNPANAVLCTVRTTVINLLNPALQNLFSTLSGVVEVTAEVGAISSQAHADPDFIYEDAVKSDGTYDASALVKSSDTTESPKADDIPSGTTRNRTVGEITGAERIGKASGNGTVAGLTLNLTLLGKTAPNDRVLPPINIPLGTDPNTPLLVSPVTLVPQILAGLGDSLQQDSALAAALKPLGATLAQLNSVVTKILDALKGPLTTLAQGLGPILEGTVNKQVQIAPNGDKTPKDVRDGIDGPMPAVEITALDVKVLQGVAALGGELQLGRVRVDPHRDFARGPNNCCDNNNGGGGHHGHHKKKKKHHPKSVNSGATTGGDLSAVGLAGLLSLTALGGTAARRRFLV